MAERGQGVRSFTSSRRAFARVATIRLKLLKIVEVRAADLGGHVCRRPLFGAEFFPRNVLETGNEGVAAHVQNDVLSVIQTGMAYLEGGRTFVLNSGLRCNTMYYR